MSAAEIPPELRDALDELDRLERANRIARFMIDPPGEGGASPKQRAYVLDESKNRAIRGANKTGKTAVWAVDIVQACLGWHPIRSPGGVVGDVPFPCKVLCVVADFQGGYAEDVCEVFREWIPPGVLHTRCTFDEAQGYRVGQKAEIRFANGSRIIFRAGTQGVRAIAGVKADMVAINEPPEMRVWGEVTRAAAFDDAPICAVFTPVDERRKDGSKRHTSGDLHWLQCILEGDPQTGAAPTGDWSIHRIFLTVEDCPHRTQEAIDRQIGNVPPWEYEQRVRGDWESVNTARRISAWTPERIIPAEVGPFEGWYTDESAARAWGRRVYVSPVYLAIVGDWGEKAGATAWGCDAFQIVKTGSERIVYVRTLAEYVSESASDEHEDADGIEAMLDGIGLRLADLDFAWGDVNTAGKSRKGRRLNDILTEILARRMGHNPYHPALVVRPVQKGPGSVDLGLKRTNQMIRRGTLSVSARCPRQIRALERWEGASDDHEHLIDRIRYAVTAIEREADAL